jgi:hypothetical protein
MAARHSTASSLVRHWGNHMSGASKKLMSAAGAGGEALAIEDVFSTYLYEGTNATQTITNGIDLDGEGGLVWIQERDDSSNSYSYVADSERGSTKYLITQVNNAEGTQADAVTSFNSDGFTLGVDSIGRVNVATGSPLTGRKYASWTFRKAPRFFDVVTYTGTGVAGLEIAHDLGVDPGFIVVKKTSDTGNWRVFHRSLPDSYGNLDATSAFFSGVGNGSAAIWGNGSVYVAPTSTNFTVGGDHSVNSSGQTYVAYLFAHNDGDGEFGPDGDADIIKCGSFSGEQEIDLGWEAGWVLTKGADTATDWYIQDNMRGLHVDTLGKALNPNTSAAEINSSLSRVSATGFKTSSGWAGINGIYIAIRRGPMRAPTSGTEVFDPEVGGASVANNALVTTTGFPVDMFMHFDNYTSGGETFVVDRLRGRGVQLRTQYTATEATYGTNDPSLDSNEGLINRSGSTQNESGGIFWSFRRAPEFFDVVAYSGQLNLANPATFTVPHNLEVIPELVIVKSRTTSDKWSVGSTLYPDGGNMVLNENGGIEATNSTFRFNYAGWTDSLVSFGSNADTGRLGNTYIAYLFATLAGISKVGSYTGNGSSQTINCGFTTGARFILIKRTDSTGDWYVWDTARGIVAGNDPHLSLNTTAAEVTTDDSIDPDSSGFIVNQVAATNINVSSASYIFYAVA